MVLLALAALLMLAPRLGADEYVVDRQAQWRQWTVPEGVVDLRPDGSLALERLAERVDPLDDMTEYEHESRERGTVRGGLTARSNTAAARRLLDDDEGTWWQPRAGDDLDRWWIEIDLGRLVLLEKVRLVFPDTVSARPFRDFAVYVSVGMPIWDGQDAISYQRVYSTILPNRERVVDINLFTRDPVSGSNAATGENLVLDDSLAYMPVQYLRFVPRQIEAGAGLAEISAIAVGQNIAPGTLPRGGSIRSSEKFQRTSVNLFDGTVEKFWICNSVKVAERVWTVGGQYFEWDLGAAFWLDQIVFYAWPPTALGQTSFQAGSGPYGHEFEVSDGTPINIGSSEERFRGPYDYERISLVDNMVAPRRWIFDHRFEPRKTRFIFYHHFNWGRSGGWGFKVWEAFLYAPGYPAEVELVSEMISLGSVRNLLNMSWEAELPPGTSVSVRTKTGDELGTKTIYYDVVGNEVTEARYNKLKSFQRGPTTQIEFEGDDWSAWSEPYEISGEAFKSPSPRQFVRFRAILSTDDSQVTPVLKSLRLEHRAALFRNAVEGEVYPRESAVGEWRDFTYVIRRPRSAGGDQGYDGLLIPVAAEVRDVTISIGGEVSEGSAAEIRGDTLRVTFGQRVRRDSVEVGFSARLVENPTLLQGFLTNSTQPGLRQGVKPADDVGPDALTVFLPDVAASGAVISNVSAGSGTVTPNGDGINDELVLTFDLLKVSAAPRISFYDLAGRVVRQLEGQPGAAQSYGWDGTTDDGHLAPPGVYVCRIEVKTDAGDRAASRVVRVAY